MRSQNILIKVETPWQVVRGWTGRASPRLRDPYELSTERGERKSVGADVMQTERGNDRDARVRKRERARERKREREKRQKTGKRRESAIRGMEKNVIRYSFARHLKKISHASTQGKEGENFALLLPKLLSRGTSFAKHQK